MGYYIDYAINGLKIPARSQVAALNAINYLHTDKMLIAHARGGSSRTSGPVRKWKWYSWVTNPEGTGGFKNLKEAFEAWRLVDDNPGDWNEDGDFVVDGSYSSKWGQQEVLLSTIAPYTEDIQIHVRGEDNEQWIWEISFGQFGTRSGRIVYEDFDPETPLERP